MSLPTATPFVWSTPCVLGLSTHSKCTFLGHQTRYVSQATYEIIIVLTRLVNNIKLNEGDLLFTWFAIIGIEALRVFEYASSGNVSQFTQVDVK